MIDLGIIISDTGPQPLPSKGTNDLILNTRGTHKPCDELASHLGRSRINLNLSQQHQEDIRPTLKH